MSLPHGDSLAKIYDREKVVASFPLKSVQQCPKADVNKYGGLDSDGGHSELIKVATLCTWSVSGWV